MVPTTEELFSLVCSTLTDPLIEETESSQLDLDDSILDSDRIQQVASASCAAGFTPVVSSMVSSRTEEVMVVEVPSETAMSSTPSVPAQDLSLECPPREKEAASKRKRKRKRASVKSPEPTIAIDPLSADIEIAGTKAHALFDSGSQADVMSSSFAHRLGLNFHRLIAPVHAELGADGHEVRLSIFTSSSCSAGNLSFPQRSFFVAPLPAGVDVILGVPWLKDTNSAVSVKKVFVVPQGPSEDVIDFESGRFAIQPQRNLDDLGFVNRPMSSDESHRFALCAIAANIPGIDDYVDYEEHNPLLDVEDELEGLTDLTLEEAEERIKELLERFSDVLVDDLPDRLPPLRPINHEIDLDEDFKQHARPIPMPTRYEKQWAAHLRKFVDTGYWSPEALDSACAMFAVPKHDKTQARFVINLKPRNQRTTRRVSPIPDMRQARGRVASHKIRTKLDFKKAYEQIRVALESIHKTGFVTKSGTFVSRVMQQGDCNAPDTMHRVCYMMFNKAIGRFVDVFYDDVFVYSNSYRDHLRHLEIVFETLRHYKFYLARDKVQLMADSVDALGAVITDEGISVDPSKWESIRNWPTPRNPKDVLRFMGTVQWLADHIPRLSELAAPLTHLTGKVDWNWTPECDVAFEAIKSEVPRTLRTLDLKTIDSGEERLFLFTDASIYGCGGWLGQGTSRHDARPIRFVSAKFNPAQYNYTTTDQELLAVLHCCVKMADYLRGVHFTVVSDHMPLRTYWQQDPKLTRRHIRMWETLAEYDFDWEFIPGKENDLADSLSRLAELGSTVENLSLPVATEPSPADDDDAPFPERPSPRMTVTVAALISAIAAKSPSSSSSQVRSVLTAFPDSFETGLRSALPNDTLAKKVLANPSAFPSFAVEDDLVFVSDDSGLRLVVPQGRCSEEEEVESTPSLVEYVIRYAHLVLGHFGAAKTLAYVRRFFWWPQMHRDVYDYCRSCEICCRNKPSSSKPFGQLHPLDTPSRPWSTASLDFVVGLPPVTLNGVVVDSILSVTDLLSKMVVLIPLSTTATAAEVAESFFLFVYRRFGLPDALVSDRDPKFTSAFWKALCAKINIKLKMSTSNHPQTDGRSEVTNKIVGTILKCYCEDSPRDWATRLSEVEFAINSAPSSATSTSPFELVLGYLPSPFPTDSWTSAPVDSVNERTEEAHRSWLKATDALIASRVDMVHEGNKHRRKDDESIFAIGGKAYVSTSGLRFPDSISGKFIPRYIGPFPIIDADHSKSTYVLTFPPHLRLHPRIHASKLRPHFDNDDSRFPSRSLSQPGPALSASDAAQEEWYVEKIVGDRMRRGKKEYKVRYEGYSAGDDQWRPGSEIESTAPELLEEYLQAQTVGARRLPGRRTKKVAAFFSSIPSLFSKPLVSSLGGVGARIT